MPEIDFSEILSNLIPAFVAVIVLIVVPVFNKITKSQTDTDYELLTELYGPLHHYFTHEYTHDSNLERLSEILYQNYYHLPDEALQNYGKILEGNRAALKKLMDETITHFASLRNKLYFYENYRWLSIYGKSIVFVGVIAIGGMVYLLATDKENHLTNSWSMTYGLMALAAIYILINIIVYILNRAKISKMVLFSQQNSRQSSRKHAQQNNRGQEASQEIQNDKPQNATQDIRQDHDHGRQYDIQAEAVQHEVQQETQQEMHNRARLQATQQISERDLLQANHQDYQKD